MSPQEREVMKKLTAAINRVADELGKKPLPRTRNVFEQHNHGATPVQTLEIQPPAPLAEPKTLEAMPTTGQRLPVYLMPERGAVLDIDNIPANGLARISGAGIDIHIGVQYYTDVVRQIIAEGEPLAITVGVNHRKKLVDAPSGMTHEEANAQIDALHGPGAAAALDAAIADGSIFGGDGDQDKET